MFASFPFMFLFTITRVSVSIIVRKECCTLERVNTPHINANQKNNDDDPARPITTKHRLISLDTNDNDKQEIEEEEEEEEEEENQYRSSSTVTSSILLLLWLLLRVSWLEWPWRWEIILTFILLLLLMLYEFVGSNPSSSSIVIHACNAEQFGRYNWILFDLIRYQYFYYRPCCSSHAVLDLCSGGFACHLDDRYLLGFSYFWFILSIFNSNNERGWQARRFWETMKHTVLRSTVLLLPPNLRFGWIGMYYMWHSYVCYTSETSTIILLNFRAGGSVEESIE